MPRPDGTILIDTKIDERGFTRGVGSLSDKATRAGTSLTRGLTLPIIAVGAAALVASTKFNEGMANVASLIPGNIERVEELKTTVQDMAVEFGTSTDDLSEGLYNVISAFGDTSDSVAILETNVKAATAGVATVTDAINLTSAVTKAYGDTSLEAVEKVADLALMAVRLGQTTFPELAAAIGRVTPLTNELGVSQEELFATMATLTGVTGGAAEVSTQLRGAMQALLAPTDKAASAIADAGYASANALIEQEGMAGALKFMTDAAETANLPLQDFIASIEGQVAALALTGPQADIYASKLAEMAGAAGTTGEAFLEQTEGINASGFAMKQAQQRVIVMAQDLGDGLAPALIDVLDALEPVLESVSDMAENFADADEETQKLILSVVALAAVLGPALKIYGTLAPVVATLKGIGIAAAAPAVAVGALGAASIKAFEGLHDLIGLTPVFEGAGEAIGEWADITDDAVQPTEKMLDLWREWGIELDENNQLTDEGIRQLQDLAKSVKDTADSTEDLSGAQAKANDIVEDAIETTDNYADSLRDLEDTQMGNERADIRLARARNRLDDATAAVKEITADSTATAREREDAALDLRDAELGLAEAENGVEDAASAANKAIGKMPEPDSTLMADWIEYYTLIGLSADEAAEAAHRATRALMEQPTRGGTGAGWIPEYGTGAFAVRRHLAVVGEEPEVIIPLGNTRAAAELLPILLRSLPNDFLAGSVASMKSSVSGEMGRFVGQTGARAASALPMVGGSGVIINVDARGSTDPAVTRAEAELGVEAALARIVGTGRLRAQMIGDA